MHLAVAEKVEGDGKERRKRVTVMRKSPTGTSRGNRMYGYAFQQAQSQIYKRLSPRGRYIVDDIMRSVPVVGSYLTARDRANDMDAYLRNYGISWDDVKNHKVNLGYGMAVRDSVGTVSKNITSLYRSSRRKTRQQDFANGFYYGLSGRRRW